MKLALVTAKVDLHFCSTVSILLTPSRCTGPPLCFRKINVSCHEVSLHVRLHEQTRCFVRTAPQGKPVKLVGGRLDAKAATNKIHPSSTHLIQTPGSTSVTGRNEGQVESRPSSARLKVTGEDSCQYPPAALIGYFRGMVRTEQSKELLLPGVQLTQRSGFTGKPVSLHQCWRQRN